MTVYSEEHIDIPVGMGLDSYNHPANLADGFCSKVDNFIAHGDRLVTRKGFQPDAGTSGYTFNHDQTNAVWATTLPLLEDLDLPAAMWGEFGSSVFALRQFTRGDAAAAAAATGNGYAEFSAESNFKGAVVYLDTLYVNMNAQIEKVTAIDWALETMTSAVVATAPTSTVGLFAFKDRLWTWDLTKIYYTDVPTSAGGLPETWSTSDNFLVVNANEGMGIIYSVVPLHNKIFVFTSAGLYTISIIGSSPTQWVITLLDGSINTNTRASAIEYRGLIFFVDVNGVWVTDGSEIREISKDIQDIFEEGSDDVFYYYKLVRFDEGILVCRNSTFHDSGSTYIASDAQIYYTRLDNIAWSRFVFSDSHVKDPGDIIGAFTDLQTFDNNNPEQYLIMASGTSTVLSPALLTAEILRYRGYQDKLNGDSSAIDIVATMNTKIVRGEPFKEKRLKYAYLNYSVVGDRGDAISIDYTWDTEAQDALNNKTETAAIKDTEEALVKLKADFYFRHVMGIFVCTLSADITEYTLLRIGLNTHTNRKESRLQG